jgi:hypothetical protein
MEVDSTEWGVDDIGGQDSDNGSENDTGETPTPKRGRERRRTLGANSERYMRYVTAGSILAGFRLTAPLEAV